MKKQSRSFIVLFALALGLLAISSKVFAQQPSHLDPIWSAQAKIEKPAGSNFEPGPATVPPNPSTAAPEGVIVEQPRRSMPPADMLRRPMPSNILDVTVRHSSPGLGDMLAWKREGQPITPIVNGTSYQRMPMDLMSHVKLGFDGLQPQERFWVVAIDGVMIGNFQEIAVRFQHGIAVEPGRHVVSFSKADDGWNEYPLFVPRYSVVEVTAHER